MDDRISVIICTRNRAHLLVRALRALSRQSVAPARFEIIVVDDGSEDDTAQVCAALQGEVANLRWVSSGAPQGLAAGRNRGIGEAVGDRILFTDDDCIPAADWVERLGRALIDTPAVAGAVATPLGDFFKLCHNIAEFYGFMPTRKAGPVDFICGANMGFRRSLLTELGGFAPEMSCAEDMEFVLRLRAGGHPVYFLPEAVVTHDPERSTLTTILKYSADHATTTVHLRNQYHTLLNTPFVLRSAPLLLLATPVIALKVTAGIYLSDVGMLKLFWTAPVVFALKIAWCVGAARGLRKSERGRGNGWGP